MDGSWFDEQSAQSLKRIIPRLEKEFRGSLDSAGWDGFLNRVHTHFPRLFELCYRLYGQQYDFFFHLESIVRVAAQGWADRPDELKALDAMREADPQWFQSRNMVGAMCYVDLFAGDIKELGQRIPYLKELGITYLHLMPVYKCPEGDNDGGYAVSSYRETNPLLGAMEDLKSLATELRRHGISLVLDFVFNHTSDEHDWAVKALSGDTGFQQYYRMFPDRQLPDAYETHIRAVFPDEHPGCFTYRSRIKKWVWTTFHNYQWDLNYENPEVLARMTEEMLYLANLGVEVLRMDAVAFIWKKLGTDCENLPQAHMVIRVFNAIIKMVAPASLFKSEAIVHPDEVPKYVDEEECALSYNPQLMALLWEGLATRSVSFLRHAMQKRFQTPQNCAWVNYVRSHDDIGWVFSNEDAAEIGISGFDHRRFLTQFYTGRFDTTFARGLPFQDDPIGDSTRVSGTTASLCGLEQALELGDAAQIDLSIRRILLLHGIILTIGGIPLFYLGDEIGMLNNYEYQLDSAKDGDTRWVHRAKFDWSKAEGRTDRKSVEGRIFNGLLRLIQVRQRNLAFARSDTEIIDTGNDHIFGYFRQSDEQNVLVLANFIENTESIYASRLRLFGLGKTVTDVVSGQTIKATQKLELEPYQFMVLLGVR
jgi:amylosucrase/maltose alpha-D-glucosyltransferase/alpha-amylase